MAVEVCCREGREGDLIESLKQRNILFIELLIFLKV